MRYTRLHTINKLILLLSIFILCFFQTAFPKSIYSSEKEAYTDTSIVIDTFLACAGYEQMHIFDVKNTRALQVGLSFLLQFALSIFLNGIVEDGTFFSLIVSVFRLYSYGLVKFMSLENPLERLFEIKGWSKNTTNELEELIVLSSLFGLGLIYFYYRVTMSFFYVPGFTSFIVQVIASIFFCVGLTKYKNHQLSTLITRGLRPMSKNVKKLNPGSIDSFISGLNEIVEELESISLTVKLWIPCMDMDLTEKNSFIQQYLSVMNSIKAKIAEARKNLQATPNVVATVELRDLSKKMESFIPYLSKNQNILIDLASEPYSNDF